MYLLDTCAFFSAITKSLPEKVLTELGYARSLYISTLSIWEIALKKDRPGFKLFKDADIYELMESVRVEELELKGQHAWDSVNLPSVRKPSGDKHNDPFDRAIIQQAKSERLTLVTSDQTILKYDCSVLSYRRKD
jgi:PIN domain nuclease of toxin-antitoxin system